MKEAETAAPITDVGTRNCYTSEPAESLAMFEQARSKCPVAHSSGHDGFYMLLNYGDVRKATGDYKAFSSEPQVLRPMLPRQAVPALEMDPPRHGAWRAVFNSAVTPQVLRVAASFIRNDVRERLGRIGPLGRCDIVRELCEPVPAETICHLMGVDMANVPPIREAAIAMFKAQGDPELFGQRQAAFGELTLAEIRERRARPRDDFMTRLTHITVEGRKLEDADYVVLFSGFLGAGHHSTTSAMASLVLEVFSRPEVRDRLISQPELIPAAVEEALRLRPPFFGFYRRAVADTCVADVPIPQESDVYLGWAAANRDGDVFPEPTEFSLDRENGNRHMSFGFGIHSCAGAPLARLELCIALEELLSEFPDLELEGPVPDFRFGGGDYVYLPELNVSYEPHDVSGAGL